MALSNRGQLNVDRIMPNVPKSMLEPPEEEDDCIDLSLAENWLIRNEVLEIYKEAISEHYQPKVRSSLSHSSIEISDLELHSASSSKTDEEASICHGLRASGEMLICWTPWRASSAYTSSLICLSPPNM